MRIRYEQVPGLPGLTMVRRAGLFGFIEMADDCDPGHYFATVGVVDVHHMSACQTSRLAQVNDGRVPSIVPHVDAAGVHHVPAVVAIAIEAFGARDGCEYIAGSNRAHVIASARRRLRSMWRVRGFE